MAHAFLRQFQLAISVLSLRLTYNFWRSNFFRLSCMFLPHPWSSSHPLVINFNTAKTTGTSFVHPRLDFCNSLYYGLPRTQSNRLQHIQNSLARAVVAAHRSSDADLILRVTERIEYKIASTTYKLLQHSSPQYLHNLITIQPSRSTRSSSVVTVLHPQLQSSLKVTMQSLFPLLSTLSLEQTSSMT